VDGDKTSDDRKDISASRACDSSSGEHLEEKPIEEGGEKRAGRKKERLSKMNSKVRQVNQKHEEEINQSPTIDGQLNAGFRLRQL